MPTTFLRFYYHASFSKNAGSLFARSGLFSTREAFEAHLHRWNRCGWSYEQTQDDFVKNAVPERLRCFESNVLGHKSQSAFTGPSRHHHVFVVELTDAENAAAFARCSPETAAQTNPWDLLLRASGVAA